MNEVSTLRRKYQAIIGRRGFLHGSAVCSALAASGAGSSVPVRATGDADGPRSAWMTSPSMQDYPDLRTRAVAFGILAPNVQNLQPWIAERQGNDVLLIYADLSRRLPVSDPPDRQLTVSFGTFVELMAIGMSTQGCRLEIDEFPEGAPEVQLDRRPLLRIRLFADRALQPDPLAGAILSRSTNRLPFDVDRPVTQSQITAVREGANDPDIVDGASDATSVARIRSIAREAYILETSLDPLLREIANTTRIGPADVAAYRWGPVLLGPLTDNRESVSVRRGLIDSKSEVHAAGVAAYLKAVDSGHAYVWVATPDNSRQSMLRAGRAWARMHLQATMMGLKLQPHSQSLHDYPEITALKRSMHETLNVSGSGRIQMLGRIGYADAAPHSPREAAHSHVVG